MTIRHSIYSVIICFAGLLPCGLHAQEETSPPKIETITWAINSAAPFHVLSGPLVNQGMCDELTDAVERALPETEFSTVFMPQTRIGVELERNVHLCFPCMIYNPGQHDRVYFTEPTHWYPPHGVITTHELAAELIEQFGNPIQLSALLENEQYYFAYPHGRKFGELQPILDSHSSQNSYRIVRTGDNASTAILAMIRADRVHYTIDYPILVEYDRQTVESDMMFIPIQENQDSVVLGAIGCTQNAWGEQAVKLINNVLPTIRNDEQFMARLAMYYNNIPDYFVRYEQLVRQHQRSVSWQASPTGPNHQPENPFL